MPYRPGNIIVPEYTLVQKLGKGGFGEVWKATGPGGIDCAIKIISLSGNQGFKEFRAIKLFRGLRHPNLVPLLGIWLKDENGNVMGDEHTADASVLIQRGQADELICAMGLGEKSLLDRLKECKKAGSKGIPPIELLEYMDSAAKAIDFLNAPIHNMGQGPVSIQHCDIKPGNILIVGGSAQVCDFGLARVLSGEVRSTTQAFTPAYTAPEMAENKPSRTTDQYALAITYVELRTGKLPFDSTNPSVILGAHLTNNLNLSALPPGEAAVIRKATSLDPEQRFPTTVEMVQALRAAVTSTSRPPSQALIDVNTAGVQANLEIVPGFKTVRKIGQGGYGEVWEATAPGGKPCALKIIRNLDGAANLQEFRILEMMKSLEHDNLMELQAYWLVDNQGQVLPYEVGQEEEAARASTLVIHTALAVKNLAQRLKECQKAGQKGIPVAELLSYMKQSADALDYLNTPQHELQGKTVSITHRDVKPENILLSKANKVKLSDFGLAKMLEGASATIHSQSRGLTVAYAAPEMFKGSVSRWTDQYSLAITYYKLRTGMLPFDSKQSYYNLILIHSQGQLDFSGVPAPEQQVLRRATALIPEHRYPTCMDFVNDLERAVAMNGGLTATPTPGALPEIPEQTSDYGQPSGAQRSPTAPAVTAGIPSSTPTSGAPPTGQPPAPAGRPATPSSWPSVTPLPASTGSQSVGDGTVITQVLPGKPAASSSSAMPVLPKPGLPTPGLPTPSRPAMPSVPAGTESSTMPTQALPAGVLPPTPPSSGAVPPLRPGPSISEISDDKWESMPEPLEQTGATAVTAASPRGVPGVPSWPSAPSRPAMPVLPPLPPSSATPPENQPTVITLVDEGVRPGPSSAQLPRVPGSGPLPPLPPPPPPAEPPTHFEDHGQVLRKEPAQWKKPHKPFPWKKVGWALTITASLAALGVLGFVVVQWWQEKVIREAIAAVTQRIDTQDFKGARAELEKSKNIPSDKAKQLHEQIRTQWLAAVKSKPDGPERVKGLLEFAESYSDTKAATEAEIRATIVRLRDQGQFATANAVLAAANLGDAGSELAKSIRDAWWLDTEQKQGNEARLLAVLAFLEAYPDDAQATAEVNRLVVVGIGALIPIAELDNLDQAQAKVKKAFELLSRPALKANAAASRGKLLAGWLRYGREKLKAGDTASARVVAKDLGNHDESKEQSIALLDDVVAREIETTLTKQAFAQAVTQLKEFSPRAAQKENLTKRVLEGWLAAIDRLIKADTQNKAADYARAASELSELERHFPKEKEATQLRETVSVLTECEKLKTNRDKKQLAAGLKRLSDLGTRITEKMRKQLEKALAEQWFAVVDKASDDDLEELVSRCGSHDGAKEIVEAATRILDERGKDRVKRLLANARRDLREGKWKSAVSFLQNAEKKADRATQEQIAALLPILQLAEEASQNPLGKKLDDLGTKLKAAEFKKLPEDDQKALEHQFLVLLNSRVEKDLDGPASKGGWSEAESLWEKRLRECRLLVAGGRPTVLARACLVECLAEQEQATATAEGLGEAIKSLEGEAVPPQLANYVKYCKAIGEAAQKQYVPAALAMTAVDEDALKVPRRKKNVQDTLLEGAKRVSVTDDPKSACNILKRVRSSMWNGIPEKDQPMLQLRLARAAIKVEPKLAADLIKEVRPRLKDLKFGPAQERYDLCLDYAELRAREGTPEAKRDVLDMYAAVLAIVRDKESQEGLKLPPALHADLVRILGPENEKRLLEKEPAGSAVRKDFAELLAQCARLFLDRLTPWTNANVAWNASAEDESKRTAAWEIVTFLNRSIALHDSARFRVLRGFTRNDLIPNVEVTDLKEDADKAVELDADYPGGYSLQGLVLIREARGKRDFADRIKKLEEARKRFAIASQKPGIEPADELYLLRGQSMASLELGNYQFRKADKRVAFEEAEKHAKAALEVSRKVGQEDVQALICLGHALEDLGEVNGEPAKFAEALKVFEQAHNLAGNSNRKPLIGLGRVRYKTAFDRVRKGRAENQTLPAKVVEEVKKDLEKAENHLKDAVRSPDWQEKTEAYYYLAQLYLQRQLQQLPEDTPEALFSKAEAFYDLAFRQLEKKQGAEFWDAVLIRSRADALFNEMVRLRRANKPTDAKNVAENCRKAAAQLKEKGYDPVYAAVLEGTLQLWLAGTDKSSYDQVLKIYDTALRDREKAPLQSKPYVGTLFLSRATIYLAGISSHGKKFKEAASDAESGLDYLVEEGTLTQCRGIAGYAYYELWKANGSTRNDENGKKATTYLRQALKESESNKMRYRDRPDWEAAENELTRAGF